MKNFSHAETCRKAENSASSPLTRSVVFQQPHPLYTNTHTHTHAHTLNWLFFASVDTVLSKCEATDFALLNSLCGGSFSGAKWKENPDNHG